MIALSLGARRVRIITHCASSASSTAAVATRCASSSSTASFPAPLFLASASGQLSPWHDIPLRPSSSSNPAIVTFVNEIPRGSRPKFEIDTGAAWNPIIQDSDKKGAPRDYKLDSLTNYGAMPQTWEDPAHADEWTGLLGDGDPLDVCEIGSRLARTGEVYTVKILGALAMIDGGETDWKLLAIRSDDAAAAALTDVTTAPASVRRLADDIRHWFRVYKVPEGKGENEFAFDGAWLSRDRALEVIASTHRQWASLVAAPGSHAKAPWVPQTPGWAPPTGPAAATLFSRDPTVDAAVHVAASA